VQKYGGERMIEKETPAVTEERLFPSATDGPRDSKPWAASILHKAADWAERHPVLSALIVGTTIANVVGILPFHRQNPVSRFIWRGGRW